MKRALGLAALVSLAIAGCGGGDETTEELVADPAAVTECLKTDIGTTGDPSGTDFEEPQPEPVDSFGLDVVEEFETAALVNVYVFEDVAGAEAALGQVLDDDVLVADSEQNVVWVSITGGEPSLPADLDAAIRTCVTES